MVLLLAGLSVRAMTQIACEQALYLGLMRDLFWARAASGGGRIGAGLKSSRERIGAGA